MYMWVNVVRYPEGDYESFAQRMPYARGWFSLMNHPDGVLLNYGDRFDEPGTDKFASLDKGRSLLEFGLGYINSIALQ